MNAKTRQIIGRASFFICSAISIAALTGCSTNSNTEIARSASKTSSSEFFAESKYGVAASPRVSKLESDLPRGGGRDQTGKPYQIRGQWYYPKKEPNYRSTGLASWYGDAFHGRLTANGEVYDMTHLTAAHPTMPLPSYARVTNKDDGTSLIVRVNDRGPFHGNRVIDLSRRAAELLDFTHEGVARVDVEYLGRAPLHGQDDAFLMASYQPGGSMPSDGLPAGVMMAMAGETPTTLSHGAAQAFDAQISQPGAAAPVNLPEIGPVLTQRPEMTLAGLNATPSAALAYAPDTRADSTASILSSFAEGSLSAHSPAESGKYIAVGTFDEAAEARRLAAWLEGFGMPVLEATNGMVSLSLHPGNGYTVDDVLRHAWRLGADDAMTVRR